MGLPQFQIFTRRAGRIEWRLLGGNNWELGRCAGAFADLEAARSDVERLKAGLQELEAEVYAAGRSNGWRWQYLDGEHVVAVSSRTFMRRGACEATLRQFRAVASDAPVTPRLRYFT